MEVPSASERPAANRCHGVGASVRNGIGLDGERKHQRIHQGESQRQPIPACGFPMFNPTFLVFVTVENPPVVRCHRGAYLHPQQWNGPRGSQGSEF